MRVTDFKKKKNNHKKISMVTCYDYSSAQIIEDSDVDCVLVGDSVAMVVHGHSTTIPANIEMMKFHTEAVVRGIKTKFITADLPFLSYRKGDLETMKSVEVLMQAGAHSVKLEGLKGQEKITSYIVDSGVPVMGHLGLTPQSVHQLGGFKVQGRSEEIAKKIKEQSKKLEDLGCFALVLECVPDKLAAEITESLSIPTIGIGAGSQVDGQVLVYHDLLGLQKGPKLKFVKEYLKGNQFFLEALNQYDKEVKHGDFPTGYHSFLEAL